MQAAVVGMANAIGQMFNAYKEQTPLVVYSYRTDQTGRAGRDGFEEVPNQEQIVQPITKYTWLARRADMIPETIRRAFKASHTPPMGPSYISWHSDYNHTRVRTDIISQDQFDPRMRVRPNPVEVERAAKLLVEAKMPILLVGDEIYRAKAVAKAVKLAELLGMPVVQPRQMYANFPETHPLWCGNLPAGTMNSITWPKNYDVAINVGNKMQHNSPAPIVPRNRKFIDMRSDHQSMGNVMLTEVPLVADVAYGLDDLIAAVEQLLTPALKARFAERAEDVRKFTSESRKLRAQVVNSPDWNQAPIIADRLTWEVAQFADPDAIIVHEAGSVSMHSFGFNPLGGRELFFYYGAHLGSGTGTAAGVKLARPNQQVICMTGDGSFIFGPTALWNMARLQLPVITVVYNNHAYGGPHSRVINNVPSGRQVQTGQFVHDYLGNPDMDMAAIAKGFGVDGEVVQNPTQLREALRARASTPSRASRICSTCRSPAKASIGPTSPGSRRSRSRACAPEGCDTGGRNALLRMAGPFPAMHTFGGRDAGVARLDGRSARAGTAYAGADRPGPRGLRRVLPDLPRPRHGQPRPRDLRPAQVPKG